MDNTSGGGKAAAVPAEIDRWNWGAFLLNWIWGLGNHTYIALLALVPLVGIVVAFVLGARGSAWAWRNRRWDSIEAFRASQRTWTIAGVAMLVVSLLFTGAIIALMFGVFAALKSSDAYQMSVHTLDASPQAIAILGQPMTKGIPQGSININGPDGDAKLSFSASGPRGSGTVYIEASRSLGQWRLDREVLEDAKTHQRVDLVPRIGAAAAPASSGSTF